MKKCVTIVPCLLVGLGLVSCGAGEQVVRTYQEIEDRGSSFVSQTASQATGDLPDGHSPVNAGDLPPGHPTVQPGQQMTGGQTAVGQVSPVAWSIPEGWQEGRATNNRIATLLVKGHESTAACALSVWSLKLGVDANVKRWGGQLGLTSMDAVSVGKLSTQVGEGDFVDFLPASKAAGTERSMLVLMLPVGGQTFFAKFEGPLELVEARRDSFLALVASIGPKQETVDAEGPAETAQ